MVYTKKIMLGLLAVFSMFVLAACKNDESQAFANSDGSILKYNLDNAPDGMYVKKKDNVLNPLLRAGLNDNGTSVFHWSVNYDQLIPVLNSESQLIIVSSESSPQTEYPLVALSDVGWTVGTNFVVPSSSALEEEETSSLEDQSDLEVEGTAYSGDKVLFGNYQNPTSPIAGYFETLFEGRAQQVWIDTVNKQEITPSMVTATGFLKGLQKNKMYSFGIYKGTKYQVIDLKADTHVLEASGETYVAQNLKTKKSTYFVLTLPENLPNGYYSIEGYGVFRFTNN